MTEDDLQIQAMRALAFVRAPEWLVRLGTACQPRRTLANCILHTPNGGGRSKRQAARFKAMGVARGVPDLVSAVPVGGFNGAALELKVPGKYPTREQRDELEFRRQLGHAVGWADDLESIVGFWRLYFEGRFIQHDYRQRWIGRYSSG